MALVAPNIGNAAPAALPSACMRNKDEVTSPISRVGGLLCTALACDSVLFVDSCAKLDELASNAASTSTGQV